MVRNSIARVGKIIRFRNRSRIKPSSYGKVLPNHRWLGQPHPIVRGLVALRPFGLFAVLCLIWISYDGGLVDPPEFLSTEPEAVSGQFTLCGLGRGHNCVIDGDTFKLGDRNIRIVGIDAPETHPSHCGAEARIGEEATQHLLQLLNQGPFVMRARLDEPKDHYGRDLRSASRSLPDGTEQSISDEMLASGTVRHYLGGLRSGWC